MEQPFVTQKLKKQAFCPQRNVDFLEFQPSMNL